MLNRLIGTMAKDKDYVQLIHTERWLKLRRDKLTASPLCERCSQAGLVTPATEVHHVTPVEEGLTYAAKVRLMYDYHNLRSLCHACHVLTHTELGRCGRAVTKRRNEAQIAAVKKKFFE